jgi:pimeloyl-ACP methyl ester carboxylesterase
MPLPPSLTKDRHHAIVTERPPTVSGSWLLVAIGVVLGAAAVCWYAALCLLFYQGQWQMLFRPSRTISTTPATAGLAFDDIRFDVTETGLPQLDSWWIPATKGSRFAANTILFLHDGRGSLSDTVPALTSLHGLGINVFAIDYRGFGRSLGVHPTERLADEDAAAAWTYLTDTRHISGASIVVFGDGTGATFAARLAENFAPAGAVLEDVNPSAHQVFLSDARAQILPLFLLQTEKLDPSADLASAHVPRLFLDRSGYSERTRRLYALSSVPKQYVDLRSAPDATVASSLRRFLDDVLR